MCITYLSLVCLYWLRSVTDSWKCLLVVDSKDTIDIGYPARMHSMMKVVWPRPAKTQIVAFSKIKRMTIQASVCSLKVNTY